MIERILQNQIIQSLQRFPAVGLIGARQVGKTTLAKMIAERWPKECLYIDLERPSDYAALSEPERFLSRYSQKLVIIDEIQIRRELFPVLRSLIDMDRHPGRFLLLGSSSPDLVRQSGESLAGRIAYHQLSPFLLSELSPDKMDLLWIRGGFPPSTIAESEDASIQWRQDFIMTYLQRDLSVLGYDIRIPAMTLRRFWQMLAHTNGQSANLSQLAASMELSRQSVRKILDILQETFVIRQLQPFYANIKKRLVKTPKVYIGDSGVLHALLGINIFDDLMRHSAIGTSWEGFCMEQILNQIPRGWDAFFYRTQAGAEVDLILRQQLGQAPIFVEFKHSQTPKLTMGFWSAQKDLLPKACYVVYPGTIAYPLTKSVEVLPLTQINKIWE
ncbi:MAG: ATP-binding protein [Sedimentisphaerales bacterium]|nr:ATP-binding protein [Sedimentisphaerales bacterium]